jgi:hypothetical protein
MKGNDGLLTTRTDKWSPALQIRTVLISIQALLSSPNPDDPLANDVAAIWKENQAQAIATGNRLASSGPISLRRTEQSSSIPQRRNGHKNTPKPILEYVKTSARRMTRHARRLAALQVMQHIISGH